jgi:hypothetical protein
VREPVVREPVVREPRRPTQKYYAVRAGSVPGVYATWAECEAVTTGFRGAVHKSFYTKLAAEEFVRGGTSLSLPPPPPPSTPCMYCGVDTFAYVPEVKICRCTKCGKYGHSSCASEWNNVCLACYPPAPRKLPDAPSSPVHDATASAKDPTFPSPSPQAKSVEGRAARQEALLYNESESSSKEPAARLSLTLSPVRPATTSPVSSFTCLSVAGWFRCGVGDCEFTTKSLSSMRGHQLNEHGRGKVPVSIQTDLEAVRRHAIEQLSGSIGAEEELFAPSLGPEADAGAAEPKKPAKGKPSGRPPKGKVWDEVAGAWAPEADAGAAEPEKPTSKEPTPGGETRKLGCSKCRYDECGCRKCRGDPPPKTKPGPSKREPPPKTKPGPSKGERPPKTKPGPVWYYCCSVAGCDFMATNDMDVQIHEEEVHDTIDI